MAPYLMGRRRRSARITGFIAISSPRLSGMSWKKQGFFPGTAQDRRAGRAADRVLLVRGGTLLRAETVLTISLLRKRRRAWFLRYLRKTNQMSIGTPMS